MQGLLEWDAVTYEAINSGLQNPFMDWLMPIWRNGFIWAPLYMFLAAILVVNYKKQGLIVVLAAILLIALSDQLSAHVIKPYVQRLRPCNDVMMSGHVRNLIPCGSGYSFPSAHATNHFALAVYLIFMFPRRRMPWVMPVLLFWAFSVSFAQVYVGVHYPLDVIFGGALGIFLALFVGNLVKGFAGVNLEAYPLADSKESSRQEA